MVRVLTSSDILTTVFEAYNGHGYGLLALKSTVKTGPAKAKGRGKGGGLSTRRSDSQQQDGGQHREGQGRETGEST